MQPLSDCLARVESVKSYTGMRLQAMPGDREAGEPIVHECLLVAVFNDHATVEVVLMGKGAR